MGKNITVYDIAKEAGVSVATVSRVLNDNDKVAEITRQKVQYVIDKHDFKPNELARSLFKNETKMIGCILPDITNPYFSSVFVAAEKYAMELGYALVLCNAFDKAESDIVYLNTLIDRQVDGIIYMGRSSNVSAKNFDKYLEKFSDRVPIAMINWDDSEDNCFHIQSKEEEGFQMLINELMSKGHKKIALIGGRTGVIPTDIKYKVLKKAQSQHHLLNVDYYRTEGDYTIESGIYCMNKLLKIEDLPTAVMGINDMVAIGALRACHMNGVKVPEDLVITGFDNIPLAGNIFPTLTTVSHDYENLGKKAVDVIIDSLTGSVPEKLYTYGMTLIKGESF